MARISGAGIVKLPSAPRPANRFTTDLSVRTGNRESTISGKPLKNALLLDGGDGNDYILLELDVGVGSSALLTET